MEYVFITAAVVFVAILISWKVTSRGRVFMIRIHNRIPSVVRGRVGQGFMTELADVISRHDIQKGTIRGFNRTGRVSLGFSRSIPPACRQAIRNVWAMHSR